MALDRGGEPVILMVALGVMLAAGVVGTAWWGGASYARWIPGATAEQATDGAEGLPSLGNAARRYLRGLAVALVAGFWTGALVTGPAMRLIMRLLAATAGDGAQGRLTEADEVVGTIDFDGTLGLLIFGGILPGLLSGFIYVVVRRWLPAGRAGGVVFGLFHLVIAATRIDPLRPDNIDFRLVGPGWLAVLTFGAATVLHGMAIAAIANRFSQAFPSGLRDPSMVTRAAVVAALLPALLILIPGVFLLLFLGAGMIFAVGLLRLPNAPALRRSRAITKGGRLAALAVAAAFLPWTVTDLASIVNEPQTTRALPRPDSLE